tara:strand:- start:166 stop:591 length:426 start_codon:yes stop_codon:yes gene_type:complete
MRLIIVGCEYSGVTTLINELYDWGNERGVHHPLDDHFTILDAYHLSQEEQNSMLDVLPGIKERFQRFQIADLTEFHYIPLCPHNICGPVGTMAVTYVCAAVPNFQLLEFHPLDNEVWSGLLEEQGLIQDGHMTSPPNRGSV